MKDLLAKEIIDPETGNSINRDDIKLKERDHQIEIITNWFYTYFTDPVHCCPYITKEGGYQYIYGGPYDANDILFDIFGGVVDEQLIIDLADELNDSCSAWSGVPLIDDYYDYETPYETVGILPSRPGSPVQGIHGTHGIFETCFDFLA